jgi:hypothetical protein
VRIWHKSSEKIGYQANSEAIKRFISHLIEVAHYYKTSDGVSLIRKWGFVVKLQAIFQIFYSFWISKNIDSISLNF